MNARLRRKRKQKHRFPGANRPWNGHLHGQPTSLLNLDEKDQTQSMGLRSEDL